MNDWGDFVRILVGTLGAFEAFVIATLLWGWSEDILVGPLVTHREAIDKWRVRALRGSAVMFALIMDGIAWSQFIRFHQPVTQALFLVLFGELVGVAVIFAMYQFLYAIHHLPEPTKRGSK